MSNTTDSSASGFSLSFLGGNGISTSTIIAMLAGSVSFIVALVNSAAAYYRDKEVQAELWASERRFETFKKDLQDRQRRLVRFENVQELMKQYKKPLLQSAFDLQSRLANQVKQGFLHVFMHQRHSDRDLTYARLNFAFVISEFLGWLEVIRQEIVFITGQEDAVILSSLVDAIKFQFTGETPVQGVPPRGKEEDKDFDRCSNIMQLYAGELRAIGEVMIVRRDDAGPNGTQQNLNVIGYAEFVRRMKKEGIPANASPELRRRWETQELFLQRALQPLLTHIDALAAHPKGDAPYRRLAILQVLLCRLIDMLDNAMPWDAGNKYDLEAGEEPQYIPRDFRITPLVAHLTPAQRQWLASQPFMATADMYVDDPYGDWDTRVLQAGPEYRKLCFCGFRDDLARMGQEAREKGGGPDMWPGCFPPRAPRRRPMDWYIHMGLPPPGYYGQPMPHGHAPLATQGSLGVKSTDLSRPGAREEAPPGKAVPGAAWPSHSQQQQATGSAREAGSGPAGGVRSNAVVPLPPVHEARAHSATSQTPARSAASQSSRQATSATGGYLTASPYGGAYGGGGGGASPYNTVGGASLPRTASKRRKNFFAALLSGGGGGE